MCVMWSVVHWLFVCIYAFTVHVRMQFSTVYNILYIQYKVTFVDNNPLLFATVPLSIPAAW